MKCPQCGFIEYPIKTEEKPWSKEEYMTWIKENIPNSQSQEKFIADLHLCGECGNFCYPSPKWKEQGFGVCNKELDIADPEGYSICSMFSAKGKSK